VEKILTTIHKECPLTVTVTVNDEGQTVLFLDDRSGRGQGVVRYEMTTDQIWALSLEIQAKVTERATRLLMKKEEG